MESNSLNPYSITCDDDWYYSFLTKNGLVYHVYFIPVQILHPDFNNVYEFIIETESNVPRQIDIRIAHTVVSILRQFFMNNSHAMIIVCDTLDGKEKKRKLLFDRWFLKYGDGSLNKYDSSVVTDDYLLYVSIFIKETNPLKDVLISAFHELVNNDFYPL